MSAGQQPGIAGWVAGWLAARLHYASYGQGSETADDTREHGAECAQVHEHKGKLCTCDLDRETEHAERLAAEWLAIQDGDPDVPTWVRSSWGKGDHGRWHLVIGDTTRCGLKPGAEVRTAGIETVVGTPSDGSMCPPCVTDEEARSA